MRTALPALFVFFALHNLVFLSFYGRPPHYDPAYQVTLSLDMADVLAQRPPPTLDRILDVSGFYPPLLYLYTAPLYLLAGRSLFVARAGQLGFLLILLWSVYALGRRLAGERVGLLAAALCGLYPIVFGTSRLFTNDFPLTALVALALERLSACEGFRRFGPSVHFGLACAAGMLVKWTFVCFLLPPVVYVLVWETCGLSPERWPARAARDATARWGLYAAFFLAWCALLYGAARAIAIDGAAMWAWTVVTAGIVLVMSAIAHRIRDGFPPDRRPPAPRPREAVGVNLLFAFLAALIPCWPWYVRHSDYVLGVAATVVEDMSVLRGMPALTQPAAWSCYLETLLSHQLHLLFFMLAGVALAWTLWQGGWPRVLAALFLAQYVIVSAIRHKDPRYFMPALPILAVLSAWWMLGCLPRRARLPVVACVLVCGVLQLEAISWGSPLPREVVVGGVQVWKEHGYGSHEGLGERWPLDEMVAVARRHAPEAAPDRPAVIALFANADCLHYEALNAAAKRARLPVRTEFVGEIDQRRRADYSLWSAMAKDFILMKTGWLGPDYSLGPLPEALERLGGVAAPRLPMHDFVQRWHLPDGSQASLYQRRAAPAPPVRFGDVAVLERAEFVRDASGPRLLAWWRHVDEQHLDGVLVFVHLLREDGSFVAPYSFSLRQGDGTTDLGGGTAIAYPIPLPADLPSGRYRLALGLWRPAVDERRIPASTGGDSVAVGEAFEVP